MIACCWGCDRTRKCVASDSSQGGGFCAECLAEGSKWRIFYLTEGRYVAIDDHPSYRNTSSDGFDDDHAHPFDVQGRL